MSTLLDFSHKRFNLSSAIRAQYVARAAGDERTPGCAWLFFDFSCPACNSAERRILIRLRLFNWQLPERGAILCDAVFHSAPLVGTSDADAVRNRPAEGAKQQSRAGAADVDAQASIRRHLRFAFTAWFTSPPGMVRRLEARKNTSPSRHEISEPFTATAVNLTFRAGSRYPRRSLASHCSRQQSGQAPKPETPRRPIRH